MAVTMVGPKVAWSAVHLVVPLAVASVEWSAVSWVENSADWMAAPSVANWAVETVVLSVVQ